MDSLFHLFMMIIALYTVSMYTLGTFVGLFLKPLDVKRDYSHTPSLSVLLSGMNEGPAVYKTIESLSQSDYPGTIEILAFDDCSSDDTYTWMKKAAADFPMVRAFKNPQNQGKALTMLQAAKLAVGEIIVGVDSDCHFSPKALHEITACMANPRIGGVGGRVGIRNLNENLMTQAQGVFYFASYFTVKRVENLFRKVQCLSGPLVAIRRDVYLGLENQITKRNFLSVKITNGEDRALTQMLLRAGYDTYVNTDAVCWTSAPTTIAQYLKQQLRWRRSALGQWLDAINRLHEIAVVSPMSAFLGLLPVYVLLCWVTLMLTSWAAGMIGKAFLFSIVFHLILAPFISIGYLLASDHPMDRIKNRANFVLGFSLSSFWFPLSGFVITIFAAFSLDDGGWVTRGTSKPDSPHEASENNPEILDESLLAS